MCSAPSKQFPAPMKRGSGGNTTTPSTVYASSAAPSLTNVGGPALPAAPGRMIAGTSNPYTRMRSMLR